MERVVLVCVGDVNWPGSGHLSPDITSPLWLVILNVLRSVSESQEMYGEYYPGDILHPAGQPRGIYKSEGEI